MSGAIIAVAMMVVRSSTEMAIAVPQWNVTPGRFGGNGASGASSSPAIRTTVRQYCLVDTSASVQSCPGSASYSAFAARSTFSSVTSHPPSRGMIVRYRPRGYRKNSKLPSWSELQKNRPGYGGRKPGRSAGCIWRRAPTTVLRCRIRFARVCSACMCAASGRR